MPLETNKTNPEDMIADEMVAFLQTVPVLQQPEIHIEAPVDIVRVVEKMQPGHLLIDIWPVGMSQEPLNRIRSKIEYEIHLGVRMKVEQQTKEVIRTCSWYRTQAQQAFGPRCLFKLPDGSTAHLLQAEPFAPYSRDSLRERGVYLAPILFRWARSARGA